MKNAIITGITTAVVIIGFVVASGMYKQHEQEQRDQAEVRQTLADYATSRAAQARMEYDRAMRGKELRTALHACQAANPQYQMDSGKVEYCAERRLHLTDAQFAALKAE